MLGVTAGSKCGPGPAGSADPLRQEVEMRVGLVGYSRAGEAPSPSATAATKRRLPPIPTTPRTVK